MTRVPAAADSVGICLPSSSSIVTRSIRQTMVMQQSSRAQDHNLNDWFAQIQQGAIKLPRFQRHEAWDRGRIASFLNTVIHNLPVGVTLILDVAGTEKFESRYIETAVPQVAQPVTRHLLDGQQRLTAFWRSMHNNYPNETYFLYLPGYDRQAEPNEEKGDVDIRCIPRWRNKQGFDMPRWADDPAQCLERGLVPVSLLRPGDITGEIDSWIEAAMASLNPAEDDPEGIKKLRVYMEQVKALSDLITSYRTLVATFNLPYLALPASTTKEVALRVFINMNTNSKPLSIYDIIVAELESATESSLHTLQQELEDDNPKLERYASVPNLLLTTSALLQDKLPNERGMVEMDKRILAQNWPKLTRGLSRLVKFLEQEGIFDAARLPTGAVLPVIAAAYDQIPEVGDRAAKGERLLRRYLWSSFFTDRYENAAATRAYADFKAIKELLATENFDEQDLSAVPVLNRTEYPLAEVEALLTAGWPKKIGIRARGILAVTTLLGARDFADHQLASYDSVQHREYHHVFPAALLEDAGMEAEADAALNCALITWKTNRNIGRKDPVDYLKERVEWADTATIRERLRTHLISFDRLLGAKYDGLEGVALRQKLEPEYRAFLRERAELVVNAMKELTGGGHPKVPALD